MSVEKEYFIKLASQLIKEVSPPTEFKEFVDNTDLLGKYIESSIRGFIKKIIFNGKISTGGVISPEDPKAKSQIDVIIWKPNPYPAIFECENFAIVPKRSVFGLIEIKSSNYSKSIQNIENSIKSYSNMMTEGLSYSKGVGVVCLYTGNKIEQEKLTSNKPYFILFTKKGDSDIEPNPKGIISFIQYLINLEYDLMRVDLLKKPTNNLINSLD